jgi:adenylate cyclase
LTNGPKSIIVFTNSISAIKDNIRHNLYESVSLMVTSQRKLLAIMFTDIVGYTSLMSSNEKYALKILQLSRNTLKPLIKQFHGEWIKEIGDGSLSTFSSALDAVSCAMEVQRALKDTPDINIRIGIHVGDVVISKKDVFGTGVNIASRIESLAAPGSICISDAVYEHIRNQPGIKVFFIGERELKGVDHPIKIYSLTGSELKETDLGRAAIKQPSGARNTPSIAVMPFANISNDPGQEYFCEGMAEEILNALAQVEDLFVVARTSSFIFKDRHEDVREIGRKLNVASVLKGSVRKEANLLRVTVQLINVNDGYLIWSERFEHSIENVFAIQDEISLKVVEKLKVELLGEKRKQLAQHSTENPDAYKLQLMGRYFLNKLTGESLHKAIQHFKQAVNLDPLYGRAYSGLSSSYLILGYYGFRPETESFPEAKALALRAIEIDTTIAEAHSILGMVKFLFEWEWNEAEKEFRYALKLNPNNANTRIMHALYLEAMGHHSESITEAKKAVELDPLSVICLWHLGIILLRAGLQEQADHCFLKILELVPDHHNALWLYGQSLVLQSKYDEGIATLQKAVDLSDRNEMILAGLGWAYAIASCRKEAIDVLTELQKRSKSKPVRAIIFAKIYSGLGDMDKTFDWLEKAYHEHNLPLVFIKTDETMENIRSDPRFHKLLERMRLS